MIARRDLLFGASCALAAGAAAALRPRSQISLLGSDKIAEIVPSRFGPWVVENIDGLVQPASEGSLADRLYAETVARGYRHEGSGVGVMLLIAHGAKQSDLLQLHRPETCYPAFGFELSDNRPSLVPLTSKVSIPARQLTATARGRIEQIVYWTRLGEYLPTSRREQGEDRLRLAMRGYIADGLLVRGSVVDSDGPASFALIESFFRDMVFGISPEKRRVLIGTEREELLRRTMPSA